MGNGMVLLGKIFGLGVGNMEEVGSEDSCMDSRRREGYSYAV